MTSRISSRPGISENHRDKAGNADGSDNGSLQEDSQDKHTAAPTDQGQKQTMLYVVFASLILDLLAFTMILPLLPALLEHYGQQKEDRFYAYVSSSVQWFRQVVGAPDTPRWNSVLFGGLIGSLFSLLQFLASPLIGAASDAYGRRPILLLTSIGMVLSYAVWAVSRNFTIFVIARVMGGISKGNISLSTAIVADLLPPKRRGKGMALIGVAFSVGFVMGPLIGAYFARTARSQDTFYVIPALLALGLATANVIYIAMFFRETLPQEMRMSSLSSGIQHSSHLINPCSLFGFTAVTKVSQQDLFSMRWLGLVYFIYLFIYSGLEFTLTFLTHNRFQYDSMQQGKMFFFLGILMAIIQGGYVRRLKPGTEKRMAVMGMLLLFPSFVTIGVASSPFQLYCGLALFSFASATVVPCLTTLISTFGSADQKGTVIGIFRSLGALARAFGPVFASTVYWSLGEVPCYLTGGILIILPVGMLMKIKLGQEKKTSIS